MISVDAYDYFIKNNFGNLLWDSKVLTNDQYINAHLKYLYNIGLKNPQSETQVLANQVKFANSCTFNNIYIYTVPKNSQKYLLPAQKEYIFKEINLHKTLGAQVIPADPEYMVFDFYLKNGNETPTIDDAKYSTLRIHKSDLSRRSNESIKFDVVNLILNYFNNAKLGFNINTHFLITSILEIEGVKSLETYRSDTQEHIDEISFLVWNNKYPMDDISVHTQTVYMEDFMYPILNAPENLSSRVEIIDTSLSIKIADF